MRISKKILAIALSILMAVSMMPFTVFAATVEVNDVTSFETAVANASSGDTIKLTGDIDYNGTYAKGARHNINLTGLILDLNGNSISGDNHAVVYVGDNFTIKNGNMVCTNGGSYGVVIYPVVGDWVNDTVDDKSENVVLDNLTVTGGVNCFGADVTLRNMDVTGTQYYAVWADVEASITVESGTYSSPATAVAAGGVVGAASTSEGIDIDGGEFTAVTGKNLVLASTPASKLDISNGTFKNADDSVYTVPEKYVADGAEFDSTTGTVAQTYVAKIGTVYYETLAGAISAATAGDTVTVLADTTLSPTDIVINKDLTIDFAKYTVTAARWPLINYANLTLEGTTGGLVSPRGVVDNYGLLTVNGGVYTETGYKYPALYNNASPAGEIVINGGTINSANADVYNEATLTINGGVLNSTSSSKITSSYYSYAVRNTPGSSCTINDGTITGVHGGVAAFGNGGTTTTVEINGGTITTHNSELGGDAYYPLYVSGNGTSVTVTGGNFSGPRTAVMLDDDDIGLTEDTTLTITGGTFTAPSGVAAVTRGDNDSYPAVSGGSYSSAVPAEFCAPGFVPVTEPNSQGKYEVEVNTADGQSITVEDKIHLNMYINVAAHLESGDAIEDATVVISYSDPSNQSGDTKTAEYSYADFVLAGASAGQYANDYKFTYLAAPAQIADEITATIYCNGAYRDTVTTSIKDYCDTIIADGSNAKLVALAESILDYGKAANDKFGYTDAANFGAYNKTDDVTTELNAAGSISCSSSAVFKGYAFIAKSVPALRVYVDKSLAEADAWATINSKEVKAKAEVINGVERDDVACIDITDIYAENLDQTFTVSFAGETLQINALQYAKAINGTNEVNTAFARSIYNYNKAAEAYFGAGN